MVAVQWQLIRPEVCGQVRARAVPIWGGSGFGKIDPGMFALFTEADLTQPESATAVVQAGQQRHNLYSAINVPPLGLTNSLIYQHQRNPTYIGANYLPTHVHTS